MAILRLGLDEETHAALMADAARHLRPADWHAKAILRLGLGLTFPYPKSPEDGLNPQPEEVAHAG
jgi:plasmid stability protein